MKFGEKVETSQLVAFLELWVIPACHCNGDQLNNQSTRLFISKLE